VARQLAQVDGFEAPAVGSTGAAFEQDFAALDAAGRVDQLQDGPHRHALAAAAFADDSRDAAGHDVEAHAVDGADEPFIEGEADVQIAHAEQWR
jgi:hypothetical protein